MAKRRCAACGCLFEPRRNVPQQSYCSKRSCQRTRRRRWQRQNVVRRAEWASRLMLSEAADSFLTASPTHRLTNSGGGRCGLDRG